MGDQALDDSLLNDEAVAPAGVTDKSRIKRLETRPRWVPPPEQFKVIEADNHFNFT